MLELVGSAEMRQFGDNKRDLLTRQCRDCDVRMVCNGGCPEDRFILSRDGEPGHNYLCDGLYFFFDHVRPAMTVMANLVQRNLPAAGVMQWTAEMDKQRGRNDPCPCEWQEI
ncbi:MAG: SPASM domain-containing protein [Chloroflexota bacterium]